MQVTPMRIAVCEDNKDVCVRLAAMVRDAMPDAETALFFTGEELLGADTVPDIVLLDVELGGMNGIDAARVLRARDADCAVVFVSGKEQYVFDAFDVDAVHYLLKPVEPDKLRGVLQKAAAQLDRARGSRWDRQIMVMSGGRRVRVRLDTVRYAEVFNRTIVLHTTSGQIPYYGRLHKLAEECGDDFCRTHRAYLVNLQYVDSYSASHVDIGKDRIPISKKQYPAFVEQFAAYVRSLQPASNTPS